MEWFRKLSLIFFTKYYLKFSKSSMYSYLYINFCFVFIKWKTKYFIIVSRIKESSQRIKPSLVPWACFGFYKISNIDTTVLKKGFEFKQQRKHIDWNRNKWVLNLFIYKYLPNIWINRNNPISNNPYQLLILQTKHYILINCRNVYIQIYPKRKRAYSQDSGRKDHVSGIFQIFYECDPPEFVLLFMNFVSFER